MGKRDYRKGALPFEFQPIPKDVLRMKEFQDLPASSKALMLDLMGQYDGRNNGKLCPAFEVMRRTGWVSKGTVQRAKDALVDTPFAVLTRMGHPPRTVDWIGFTWWKLDYERSMEIDPAKFPYLNFIRMTMADPNTGRAQAKKQILSPGNEGVRTRKVILRSPEIGAMERAQ